MEDVSAVEAAFVIRTAFLDSSDAARFGYSRIPLGQIANLVAPRLDEVRLRTPVLGIEAEGKSSARVALRLLDGKTETYDAVVIAVPPDRLKSIAGRPKDLGIFGLDQFTHAPIVDVHLWFDIPPGTVLGGRFGFAALLDSPVQWVFEKSAPSGETYLCCSMSAANRHVGSSSQELIDLIQRELAAVIPALADAELLRAAATRDREATFIPAVGLVRPGPATTSPRVTIAGSWTDTGWPATMESAVRSGRQAAQVLHDAIAA
jgi:protoporphyrinogen oxidase